MAVNYQSISPSGHSTQVSLANTPDECPQCHNKGTFPPLYLFYNPNTDSKNKLEVVFRCPNSKCYEVFVGYYTCSSGSVFEFVRSEPKKYIPRIFSDTIQEISPNFILIYNQSLSAENSNLNQICGVGYRKSIEFLIKDYLLSKTNDEKKKEIIKKEILASCISCWVEDSNIKNVAKRAAWLGNDETHYVRKWEQKDLKDLKKLIDLTIHWIEAEALTYQLLNEMPEN